MDTKLNALSTNQRKILQIGVVVLLAVFLGMYFFFQSKSTQVRNEVTLENDTVQIFDDTYSFKGYPDKILIHYPYFLLVQAEKPLTIIYNLETKTKEKEIKDVLLDYYDDNIVYNKKESYFNDKNLGEFCDSAFIKSANEVLCITKRSRDSVDNMLISISPDTPNLWKQIYQSENLLTTVSVVNNDLYVGEINFETKQNYISKSKSVIPVENTVNAIYSLNGQVYFASFKSALNNNQTYYLIQGDKISKLEDAKIYFYKE